MRLVWGVVAGVISADPDVQRLDVALDDGSRGTAVSYVRLAGACDVADRVLVNTTAVDLRLGTGGLHFVVARADGARGVALDEPGGGHIMKLRYTPLQFDAACVEEQDGPNHDVMRSATDLAGMPVVCCGLHSQVPLVAAAVKSRDPALRVVYVMSDFAALPIALSDVMRHSVDAGLVDATVTCGQAFGGDYEAINLHSGLLAARHVARADVVIAGIGPGIVGTATPFGHGGVAQGEAINAVAALRGRAVAVLRLSFADSRPRHHGVSHHTLTALSRIALAPALVPIPLLPEEYAEVVESALDDIGVWDRHVRADARAGAQTPDMRNVRVTTMGRSVAEDPAFFAAAFAAGALAADIAAGR